MGEPGQLILIRELLILYSIKNYFYYEKRVD